MTAFLNARCLEALKLHTLAKTGIINITPMDCRTLSVSIMAKTKLGVSETTLKRLYGFAASKFNPSLFTLNALAAYCGYTGWEAFCTAQPQQYTEVDTPVPDIFSDPLITVLLETPIPTLILKNNAPDFTVITYNKAYEVATHIPKRVIKGLTLWEAFDPLHAASAGPTLLLEAFHEAIYTQRAVEVRSLQYNILSAVADVGQQSWWNIKVVPVIYSGIVKYLLVNGRDITDNVINKDAIELAIMKELTMAEDLATTNVKLSKEIEKITESHEALINARNQLAELNQTLEQRVFDRSRKLFESEARQRALIDNAPVAIAVLQGDDHIIEIANKKITDYWGIKTSIIGIPLITALPEMDGQFFAGILKEVRETGIPYVNHEFCASLNINGKAHTRFYDMIYQPVQLVPGITDSIYIVAVDITEQVVARRKLAHSESMLRLALTAATIGTWSFDMHSKVMKYNSIFAEMLGWDNKEEMTYEQAVDQVSDDFKYKLIAVIEKATANKENYDFTYSQRRFNDGRLIWLRSIGKIMANDAGDANIFSGVLMEVSPPPENL